MMRPDDQPTTERSSAVNRLRASAGHPLIGAMAAGSPPPPAPPRAPGGRGRGDGGGRRFSRFSAPLHLFGGQRLHAAPTGGALRSRPGCQPAVLRGGQRDPHPFPDPFAPVADRLGPSNWWAQVEDLPLRGGEGRDPLTVSLLVRGGALDNVEVLEQGTGPGVWLSDRASDLMGLPRATSRRSARRGWASQACTATSRDRQWTTSGARTPTCCSSRAPSSSRHRRWCSSTETRSRR